MSEKASHLKNLFSSSYLKPKMKKLDQRQWNKPEKYRAACKQLHANHWTKKWGFLL